MTLQCLVKKIITVIFHAYWWLLRIDNYTYSLITLDAAYLTILYFIPLIFSTDIGTLMEKIIGNFLNRAFLISDSRLALPSLSTCLTKELG